MVSTSEALEASLSANGQVRRRHAPSLFRYERQRPAGEQILQNQAVRLKALDRYPNAEASGRVHLAYILDILGPPIIPATVPTTADAGL